MSTNKTVMHINLQSNIDIPMKNKNKEPRDVSYSQGYQLIDQHGLETVRET